MTELEVSKINAVDILGIDVVKTPMGNYHITVGLNLHADKLLLGPVTMKGLEENTEVYDTCVRFMDLIESTICAHLGEETETEEESPDRPDVIKFDI